MASNRIVFLDTETTGLSPQKGNHRVIDIACIEYHDGKPTGKVLQSILHGGGKPSNIGAIKVHGISDESRANKPSFEAIADTLLEFLKDSHLIIYNKAFDIGFIEAEFRLIDKSIHLENHCSQITCAMDLAKQVFGVNRISLNAACKRYKIDISSRKVHGAYVDADLTAQLYYRLIDKIVSPLASTPQSKPHKTPKAVSIPRACKHPETNELVQLNFCKNADCKNFGVPARNPKRKADGTPNRGLGNDYKLTHNKDGSHSLTCSLCNQSSTLINNRAYVQESSRVKRTQIPT
jgi:DNA polymerase III epsilon subunit